MHSHHYIKHIVTCALAWLFMLNCNIKRCANRFLQVNQIEITLQQSNKKKLVPTFSYTPMQHWNCIAYCHEVMTICYWHRQSRRKPTGCRLGPRPRAQTCWLTAICSRGLLFNGCHHRDPYNYMDNYSFTDPKGMEGWVGRNTLCIPVTVVKHKLFDKSEDNKFEDDPMKRWQFAAKAAAAPLHHNERQVHERNADDRLINHDHHDSLPQLSTINLYQHQRKQIIIIIMIRNL